MTQLQLSDPDRYARVGPTNPGATSSRSWMEHGRTYAEVDPWAGKGCRSVNIGMCAGCGHSFDEESAWGTIRTIFFEEWTPTPHGRHAGFVESSWCECTVCARCLLEENACRCQYPEKHDEGCGALYVPEPRRHKRTGKILEEYPPALGDLADCTCELTPAEWRRRARKRPAWKRDPSPHPRPWAWDFYVGPDGLWRRFRQRNT